MHYSSDKYTYVSCGFVFVGTVWRRSASNQHRRRDRVARTGCGYSADVVNAPHPLVADGGRILAFSSSKEGWRSNLIPASLGICSGQPCAASLNF